MRLLSRPITATRSAMGVPPVGKAAWAPSTDSIPDAAPGRSGRIWLTADSAASGPPLSVSA
ncbi:hypothetical protein NS319_17990 [Sphingomonas sanguinis]|uniref:Uncharacterized protein n=1 Tax=Sphingomonas sanguinis TaxID=33051 RepID=A0A147HRX8_9SPHN|nr:hypothetical protein NS319_17990 [Sphingomonas sanguinis]